MPILSISSTGFTFSPLNINHAAAAAKLLQSCPTLCDPIDGGPPGSSVPGILQDLTPLAPFALLSFYSLSLLQRD